jgi:hypothetical protein
MESIYNLVPEVVEVAVKPPMYRSTHNPKSEITGSTFGAWVFSLVSGVAGAVHCSRGLSASG